MWILMRCKAAGMCISPRPYNKALLLKQADQEKKIYSNRKKLRESEYQVGELQWTLDNIRDEMKYLAPKSKSKLGMK